MTSPPSDETELAEMLLTARARPLAVLTEKRDGAAELVRFERNVARVCAVVTMIACCMALVLPDAWFDPLMVMGVGAGAIGIILEMMRRRDTEAVVRAQRALEAFDSGPVVEVSSRVGRSETDLVRTVTIGATSWEETHRLDGDDGLLAGVARHRVADERLRSELEAGHLPEGAALSANRRREMTALLESELPGLPVSASL